MGRSVSTPRDCINVQYASFEGDSEDFRDAVYDLQCVAAQRYKSLSVCDTWVGREDHAILENDHAYIGVSEYCGLVAIWIVAKEDDYGNASALATHWCEQIKLRQLAECFGTTLRSVGHFSNGEQIFQPIDGKQRGDMGLGFTSKCGWL